MESREMTSLTTVVSRKPCELVYMKEKNVKIEYLVIY